MREFSQRQLLQTDHRTLGDYEVHRAWEGFASIRQISSGEIMHSRTPPMEEARNLYIEQSDLTERLQIAPGEDRKKLDGLIIWDVGLGAAANAMASIFCYEEQAKRSRVRPLKIVSFENDLDSLRLAVEHYHDFPYLEHGAPVAILAAGRWESQMHPELSWSLVPGDFCVTMSNAPSPPDLIFYDMFSSKTSGELWTIAVFRKLFKACAGHATELFTYSCSTANRVAMLAAGFYVARGRNAGQKLETTIALAPGAARAASVSRCEMLTVEWLKKWDRSRAKFPVEIPVDERAGFERVIRGHPQFSRAE